MKWNYLVLSASLICASFHISAMAESQVSDHDFVKTVVRQVKALNGKVSELQRIDLEASPGPVTFVSVTDSAFGMDVKFKYLDRYYDLAPSGEVIKYRLCNGSMPAAATLGGGKKSPAFMKTTDKRECSDPRENWTPFGIKYDSTLAPANRIEVIDWMAELTASDQAVQMAEMIALRLGISKEKASLFKLDSIVLESLGYNGDVSSYSFDFRVKQKNSGNMINISNTKTCKALVRVVIEARGPQIEMDGMSCRTTNEIPRR